MIIYSKLTNKEKRKILYKFQQKEVKAQYYIDSSYRIERVSQYNSVIAIRGNWGYVTAKEEAAVLFDYGEKIGQFRRVENNYCRYDLFFHFVVTQQLIKAFYSDD